MEENLSFGFNFDVKGVDPSGEDSGEAFTGERVEELETRLSGSAETTPLFNNTDAWLFNASTKQAEGIPHWNWNWILIIWNKKPYNTAKINYSFLFFFYIGYWDFNFAI